MGVWGGREGRERNILEQGEETPIKRGGEKNDKDSWSYAQNGEGEWVCVCVCERERERLLCV